MNTPAYIPNSQYGPPLPSLFERHFDRIIGSLKILAVAVALRCIIA